MSYKRAPLKFLVLNSSTVYRACYFHFAQYLWASFLTIYILGTLPFQLFLSKLQIDSGHIVACTPSSVSAAIPQKTSTTLHSFIFVAAGMFSFLLCCCVCDVVCLRDLQQGTSDIFIAGYTLCCVQFMQLCFQRHIAKPNVHDESWLHQCYSVVPHSVLLYLFRLEDSAFCMCSVACSV